MGHADRENPTLSTPPVPLRIGVLVDSLEQPAWVERALRTAVDSGMARLVLVVRNAAEHGAVRRSRLASWWRNRGHLLYAAFLRLDRRGYQAAHDPFRPVDISSLTDGVELIDVVPQQTRLVDRFADADLDRIRAANPDVLIRFGFRILRGGILSAAQYGVWSYHHGDHERYRGGPPGFWEVLEGNPVTGTVLQRLTESLDDGEILYRAFSATNQFSVTRSLHEFYWKGADFLVRALRQVIDGASQPGDSGCHAPAAYGQRLYVKPTNAQMAVGVARLVVRRIAAKRQTLLSREQWFLAYGRRAGVPDDSRLPDLAPYRFRTILPPADRFWADPFPVRTDGREFVLFEEYEYARAKGVIAALELGKDGPIGTAQTVLECDYHLSYPFLFSWRGSQFMLPETVEANRVEVYRAVRYPFEWTLESVVADEPMADCTVAEIDGRWWMFATRATLAGSFWDDLHVFHAASPLGPWTPHRRNPVLSDVRVARPAGALFRHGDAWVRPAQDCSRGYGAAITLRQIVRLDAASYEERTISRLEPGWMPGLTGVHTLNALGGLTVIDAKRRIGKAPWQR